MFTCGSHTGIQVSFTHSSILGYKYQLFVVLIHVYSYQLLELVKQRVTYH